MGTKPYRLLAALLAAVAALALILGQAPAASAAPSGLPGLGPKWTSLMHGDLASTDSTAYRGPGRTGHLAAWSVPGGPCAATFIGSDSLPVSLCTNVIAGRPPQFATPVVTLFDPATARVLATLPLAKGGLLGGVYGYLDDKNRVVVADGTGAILKVAHRRTARGWQLFVADRIDLSRHLGADSVTGLAPDESGRIWWVTTAGIVGTVTGRKVASMHLPRGEELGNGLSVRSRGVSVLTTHALYEMWAGSDGVPKAVWRKAYDRGPARKPGQLTWGSGTTPTYFGPGGDEWVAIVDNAVVPRLHVYRSDDGSPVCSLRAFAQPDQGTENSPMAWGDSLVIPSTYGFQYPPMAVRGPAVPPDAPFVGAMTRIDVAPGRCTRVWESRDRMATLPRLSTADGLIHALGYGPLTPGPQQLGPVNYVAVDFHTGRRVVTRQVGVAPLDEPLQLTGMIAPDGALWQGTFSRMLKIAR
ncbi:hypothetical protein MYK68_01615 [Gordonia sp. PP30]|uniref:hypothetical protein n=1 Tax=Gordonia sp. PP30 TaxID=2935861 RepID=UPI0020003156|nr:hypothetical protein [Gordonia sp. PP30]UQE75357.1 hypothetical protein MYK68_01615 [Gordonia sp. PP30]